MPSAGLKNLLIASLCMPHTKMATLSQCGVNVQVRQKIYNPKDLAIINGGDRAPVNRKANEELHPDKMIMRMKLTRYVESCVHFIEVPPDIPIITGAMLA